MQQFSRANALSLRGEHAPERPPEWRLEVAVMVRRALVSGITCIALAGAVAFGPSAGAVGGSLADEAPGARPASHFPEPPPGPWVPADSSSTGAIEPGRETAWSTCQTRPYTFAVNPGSAPRKMVRWGTQQFLAAAKYAHLDVTYVGFTDLDPVPTPKTDERPDFILSFDHLDARYLAVLDDYFAGWTETDATAGKPPRGGRDFGHEEITYKGAVLPWKLMKRDKPADRRAKTLHMIGFMLGMGSLDREEQEVMSIRPKGGGQWTPGFRYGLYKMYPYPLCPKGPVDLDVIAFDSNWRGIDVEMSARPASAHPFDAVIAFDYKIDYAEGYDVEDMWFSNLQDRGDGRVRLLEVEPCSQEKIPAVVTLTAYSRYGLASEVYVREFPNGLADC